MKFVSFRHKNGVPRSGVVEGHTIRPLRHDLLTHIARGDTHAATSDEAVDLSEARLCAPLLNPPRIFAIGLNYREHAAEARMKVQEVPTVFLKLSSSICGPGAEVLLPANAALPDYEAELAVVIGNGGHHIAEQEWQQHVFGYTIINDVSARGVQMATSQWMLGKSFPKFTPMGPHIVTADEVPDPHALDIKLTLSGEVMQQANTRDLISAFPHSSLTSPSLCSCCPGTSSARALQRASASATTRNAGSAMANRW